MGDCAQGREGWAECEGVRNGMTLFALVTSPVIVMNNERRERTHACIRTRVPYVLRSLELPDVNYKLINRKSVYLLCVCACGITKLKKPPA